jgi:hypothetical protein
MAIRSVVRNQDLFRPFLLQGGGQYLDEMELKIARMIVAGTPHQKIADTLSLSYNAVARVAANRIRKIALREEDKRARIAERESFILALKATKRPFERILVRGLFPKRLESALWNANVRTLGDVVTTGRIDLSHIRNVSGGDIKEIARTLALFSASLPE